MKSTRIHEIVKRLYGFSFGKQHVLPNPADGGRDNLALKQRKEISRGPLP
jgi:hypothetical protein